MVNQFHFDLSDSDLVRMHTPEDFEQSKSPRSLDVLDCFLEQVPLMHKGFDDYVEPTAALLWHWYFLGKDMALFRTLYVSDDGHSRIDFAGAPTWVASVTKPKRKSKTVLAGFIASDEDQTMATYRRPTSEYVMSHRKQKTARPEDDWTVSYERVVRTLNESNTEDWTDIDEIIEEVSALLQLPPTQHKRPMQSLREVVDGSVDVEDLEGASARLERLHLTPAERTKVKTEDEDLDLSSQTEALKILPLAGSEARTLLGLQGLDSLAEASQTIQQTLHGPHPDLCFTGDFRSER